MKKYKVEITQIQTYIIDVLAPTEEEAKTQATNKWDEVCENGTYHYHETDTNTEITHVFDVSNTDDPHNPS